MQKLELNYGRKGEITRKDREKGRVLVGRPEFGGMEGQAAAGRPCAASECEWELEFLLAAGDLLTELGQVETNRSSTAPSLRLNAAVTLRHRPPAAGHAPSPMPSRRLSRIRERHETGDAERPVRLFVCTL